jgi:hypothetical protein
MDSRAGGKKKQSEERLILSRAGLATNLVCSLALLVLHGDGT